MLGSINTDIRGGTIISSGIRVTANLHRGADLVWSTVEYAMKAYFKRTSHYIHAESEDSWSTQDDGQWAAIKDAETKGFCK